MKRLLVSAFLLVAALPLACDSAPAAPTRLTPAEESAIHDAEFKVTGLEQNADVEAIHFTIKWNKEEPLMGDQASDKIHRDLWKWLEEHPEYEKFGENPFRFGNNQHIFLLVRKKK